MSETKPLPCPCCGEDLLTRADILLTWHPRNECVLRGVSFCSEREDVIAAWNKRAPALTPKQEAAEAGCVTKPDPAMEAAIAVLIDYKADSGLVKQAERIVAAVRAADEKAGRA